MRTFALVALLVSSLFRDCGGEDEEPPPAAAPPTTVAVEATAPRAEVTVAARAPRHGGSVVVAQDYAVEVVPRPSGEVVAYVVDAQGSVPPPAHVNLTVSVWGADAHAHPVVMVWDPVHLHYRGRLVGVAPAPGPVEVAVLAHGHRRHGRLHAVAVVPGPVVHAEVRGPGVVVGRPHVRAHAGVSVVAPAPSVGVHIHAPPPPTLDVHIGAPAVHVEGRSRGVILVGPGAPGRRVGHYRHGHHGHIRGHGHVRSRGAVRVRRGH